MSATRLIYAFVLYFGLAAGVKAGEVPIPADSLIFERDTVRAPQRVEHSSTNWIRQLIQNGGHINDPSMDYPAFPRFIVNVYNWGNRVFNSYDTAYVVGTGKNWKVILRNQAWMQSYMLLFSPRSRDMLHLRSDLYDDVGAYLSFMAVSVGYTAKLNSLLGGASNHRETFNFNFTSSRIYGNFEYVSTDGGARITHFGKYNDGKSFSYPFDAISHLSYRAQVYYFLNHMKYSQAAAYCYSKYQLKSAGSAIVGLSFNHQKINMDFSGLPADMKAFLPSLENTYRFRYSDYCLTGGYGYNYAIRPRRWLFNITTLASVGYRHSYKGTVHGDRDIVALDLGLRFALVYNHRSLFATLNGNFNGSLYFNKDYTFFNSIEHVSFAVGARF